MFGVYLIGLLTQALQLQLVSGSDSGSAFITPTLLRIVHKNKNAPPSSIARKSNSMAIKDDYEKDWKKSDFLHEQERSTNHRRQLLQSSIHLSLTQHLLLRPSNARAAAATAEDQQQQASLPRGKVFEIEDPNSYSAVVYIPPAKKANNAQYNAQTNKEVVESFPLLVVLHGAGNNQHSALYEFTEDGSSSTNNPPGDHINLPPYLLSINQASSSLSENFVVVAPYVGKGKRSLYDEPRGKILSFIKWFNAWLESQTVLDESSGTTTNNNRRIAIHRQKVSLFGFSEGSTLAVELATTRQFNGVVVCAYGFTGILPRMAIQKLQGIPIWVFHSKGDDIYDIQCSNALVNSLISSYEDGALDVFSVGNVVKYTKLIPQQKNDGSTIAATGREHVRAALVASKNGDVYSWLLSQQ